MRQVDRLISILSKYGEEGVAALSAATPVDTGNTASQWYYEITRGAGGFSLVFRNANVNDGQPIAILLHYGHGTRTGGWVPGFDYINDAIQPIFDRLSDDFFKEVTSV